MQRIIEVSSSALVSSSVSKELKPVLRTGFSNLFQEPISQSIPRTGFSTCSKNWFLKPVPRTGFSNLFQELVSQTCSKNWFLKPVPRTVFSNMFQELVSQTCSKQKFICLSREQRSEFIKDFKKKERKHLRSRTKRFKNKWKKKSCRQRKKIRFKKKERKHANDQEK